MTVASADLPILVVDPQFGILIPANLSTSLNRVLLGMVMAAGATGSTTFNVPAALRIRDDMMGLGSFGHG